MRWFIRGLFLMAALIVVAFFHYSLPSRDIVRIVGTEVIRMDVGEGSWLWASKDAGTNTEQTRDVRFINAEFEDRSPRVYRNEDTGWSWPPYLKFESGNLQSQAQSFAKSQEERWAIVHHYGWRIPLISLYPNAYKIKEATGPNQQLFPWFNVVFLTILFLALFAIWRRLDRWKNRNIDPVIEDVGTAIENVGESVAERRKGLSRWLGTWRRKS